MVKIELTPKELTSLVQQAVHYEVNSEVEAALSQIRRTVRGQAFSCSAFVVAFVVISLVTGDVRGLGPAFVLGCCGVGMLGPIWLKARKREVEVRARWVPAGQEDQFGFTFQARNKGWNEKYSNDSSKSSDSKDS